MGEYVPALRVLRGERTKRSNQVRRSMHWMLLEPAKYVDDNGLPSWWAFWSDTLKQSVREAVRAARKLEAAERHAENVRILEGV